MMSSKMVPLMIAITRLPDQGRHDPTAHACRGDRGCIMSGSKAADVSQRPPAGSAILGQGLAIVLRREREWITAALAGAAKGLASLAKVLNHGSLQISVIPRANLLETTQPSARSVSNRQQIREKSLAKRQMSARGCTST